jgi:hypothetical protein
MNRRSQPDIFSQSVFNISSKCLVTVIPGDDHTDWNMLY